MANTKMADRRPTMNRSYDLSFDLTFFLLDMLYFEFRLHCGGIVVPKKMKSVNQVLSVLIFPLVWPASSAGPGRHPRFFLERAPAPLRQ